MPWIIAGVFAFGMLCMLIRHHLLKSDLRELMQQLDEKLKGDTNLSLYLSGKDRKLRAIAAKLNQQLDVLRKQQLRYQRGDLELKNAVTSISHDLRTPLTAIKGYLDLLQTEQKSPDTERYLQVIAERTDQMQTLTEELFRYSLILSDDSDAEPETVCLNALLEESIAGFYGALVSRGITPEITMPEQKVYCNCVPTALSRIISNLLQNAMKYSKGDLQISLSQDGLLIFANHTDPISVTQLEHLFDRFYTVESAQHATGLGLSIARTLTEQMGGTITAESEDGILRVLVRLPVQPDD